MDQQRHLPAATALTPEPPTLQGGVPLVVTAHRHGCLRASALALLSMAGMPFSCPQPPTTLQNSAQISHHCKSSLRDLPQFSRFVQHIKAARRGAHQWFSVQGDFAPCGILGSIWRHFWLSRGRGQVLLVSSGKRQRILPDTLQYQAGSWQQMIIWSKMSVVLRLRNSKGRKQDPLPM